MVVTAKVVVSSNTPAGNDLATLSFAPDYNDDRNKAWNKTAPSLSLVMNVLSGIAQEFPVGQACELQFALETA